MRKKGIFLVTVLVMVLAMSIVAQAQNGLGQRGACLRAGSERCDVAGISDEVREAMRGYRARGYRMMGAGENFRIVCPQGNQMRMGDANMSEAMATWAQRALECPRFDADFDGERGLCFLDGERGLCGREGAQRGVGLCRR